MDAYSHKYMQYITKQHLPVVYIRDLLPQSGLVILRLAADVLYICNSKLMGGLDCLYSCLLMHYKRRYERTGTLSYHRCL